MTPPDLWWKEVPCPGKKRGVGVQVKRGKEGASSGYKCKKPRRKEVLGDSSKVQRLH